MANTPSKKKKENLARPHAVINTDLGPVGGELGEIEEYNTKRLRPLRITQGEGGIFEIEFEYCLAAVDERLKEIEFIEGHEQMVEVELEQPSGTDNILLAWGQILTQHLRVAPDEERARVVARVTPPMFGNALKGMHVSNHADPGDLPDSDPLIHEGDIVFNPEIDGQIQGNATQNRPAVRKDTTDPMSELMILRLWIDPDSQRTEVAQDEVQRGYYAIKWTLKEAIYSLCWICNPMEPYILNPTLEELDALGMDSVILRNVQLPAGEYLPYYLSALLKQHGYSWWIHPGRNEDEDSEDFGSTEIRIKFFKLGEGVKKTVHQPKPGDTLTAGGKQNVIEWELRESFDELRNVVTAHGALIEREVTIELSKGWAESYDDLTIDELIKESPDYEVNRNVWRLWVANESGDYIGVRSEITDPLDLSEVLGDSVAVRRRPGQDCLTYTTPNVEGETRRRNPVVEWRTTPESGLETVKLTLHGDAGPPALTLAAVWSLHWMDGITEKSVGPYDESITTQEIANDLIDQGLSFQPFTLSGGLSSGISMTFAEGLEAPDFWVEAEFTGGINPGFSIRSDAWQPIPDGWGPVLLGDQLGVYFNGDKAVEDLLPKGNDARIRITCTLTGDNRISYTSEKEDSSPLGHVHEMVLDVSDRFFDRQVQRTGRYMSSLIGIRQNDTDGLSGADEVDSTEEIEEYADNIKAIEDAVNVVGRLRLTGIRPEYSVGDLIKEIDGRKVSLNRKASGSGLTQYVQVTEKVLEFHPRQRTVLELMPLDQSDVAITSLQRKRRRR